MRQYSVSPGNFAGGLSTIEEKSMGALIKSGSRPIEGVLKVGVKPPHPGLWLLDSTPDPYWMQFGITNPNDSEGLMDLAACHSHIAVSYTHLDKRRAGHIHPGSIPVHMDERV